MEYSNKKKQTTHTYSNREASQKHYAKWKKPKTKGYTLYDYLYHILKKKKCRDRSGVARAGGGWGRQTIKEHSETLQVIKMSYTLIYGSNSTTVFICQSLSNCISKKGECDCMRSVPKVWIFKKQKKK